MKKVDPGQGHQPGQNPAESADESHGKIKGPQLTDRNMPENDIARGAETGAGRGGAGARKP